VDFGRAATLHVRRAKNSKPSAHPLRGDEVRALRELRRQCPDSAFVFATKRGGPFTPDAVNRLIKRNGERADFAFPSSCVRLRAGQCRPRHLAHSGLARPPIDPAHDALHAIERGAVQRLLEVKLEGG
jgi:hypothetical protein